VRSTTWSDSGKALLAEKKRVYWDACIWFALIKQEAGRFARCQHIIDLARRGEVEIWTSALTLAEVFRKQCGGIEATGLPADKDKEFEDFLAQDFVIEVQLDRPIGVSARRLLRAHAPLKKPQDAVHLASAVWNDLDEFHTFDAVNLLCLDGSITTRGGRPLRICEPPEPPPDLFSSLTPIEEAATVAPVNREQLVADFPPPTVSSNGKPQEAAASAAAAVSKAEDISATIEPTSATAGRVLPDGLKPSA
jgi:predicted nucleic acid-binding protein